MSSRKVCKHGLNDIWINDADGSVRICGWSNYFIGKLTQNSLEEIWNGELANEFRESMLDGSYRYCNSSKCPYCANGHLDDMLVEYEVPEWPGMCNLSYQAQCNYVCKFCREKQYVSCECEAEKYKKIENEVKKMIPHLKTLFTNGAGEFFCSASIMNLINTVELPSNLKIGIETNGSLFNEDNWNRIKKVGDHELEVMVTIHSFNEDTYRYLSGTTLSVNRVKENLKFISSLRKQEIINKFEIATVVCERNFREMPEFVKQCLQEYDMDTIRLRFFEPYSTMDLVTEWFYDVRNEYHPYHSEFVEVMKDPIFMNPKVWKWQGETKSLQAENPYVLEKRRGEALAELIVRERIGDALKKYFKQHSIKKLALYGAAKVGEAYCKILKGYGIPVDVIFDTYASEEVSDLCKVMAPNEKMVQEYDLILITVNVFESQIVDTLHRLSYKGRVMTVSHLLCAVEEDVTDEM